MLFYIQITTSFILPIFTVNLSNTFNLNESTIALIFTTNQLVSAFTAVLAAKVATVSRRRWISALGCLIITLSIFLMGPSKILELPNSFQLILIAMFVNGIGLSFVFIHVTPEVIRSVCEKKGIKVGSNTQLNERASTLFEFTFSFGQCVGPPIGGAIADNIGYRNSMDVVALFSVICGLVSIFALLIKK